MIDEGYLHYVRTKSPTATRALIEVRLGVKTQAEPCRDGEWMVSFSGPRHLDLDFLRPDVLPPK